MIHNNTVPGIRALLREDFIEAIVRMEMNSTIELAEDPEVREAAAVIHKYFSIPGAENG